MKNNPQDHDHSPKELAAFLKAAEERLSRIQAADIETAFAENHATFEGFCIAVNNFASNPLALIAAARDRNGAAQFVTLLCAAIYTLGREAGVRAEREGKPVDDARLEDLLNGVNLDDTGAA